MLQVLDLSENMITGDVSGNFTKMRGFRTDSKQAANSTLAPLQQSLEITVKDHQLKYEYILLTLTSMSLASNNLQDSIPENIVELTQLKYLNLSYNKFSGTIPSNLGDLYLESLDLSYNRLTGSIPPSLGKSSNLGTLMLAYNNLSGQIPEGNQLQSMNITAFLPGNDGLCGAPLNRTCDSLIDIIPADDSTALSFSNVISPPGFVVGIVVGFVSVVVVFLTWSPAKDFLQLSQLTNLPKQSSPTGLWRAL